MSEEEMKNQIEYIIEVVTQGDDYTLRYYDIQCIMRLLDLYKEAEKERDGIYNDYQDLGKENLKLQEKLEQEKEKNKSLKKQIKEKIEELEKEYKEYENSPEWEIFDETKYAYGILKELLENK